MKKNRNKILVIILVLIIVVVPTTIFFVTDKLKQNNTILDEVKLVDNIDKNMFAIMLQKENGSYEEDKTMTSWPTENYTYNATKSGCIDIEGNKIERALSYVDGKATVSTNKTAYCYLYFDLDQSPRINSVEIVDKTTTSIQIKVNATPGTEDTHITKFYYREGTSGQYTPSESNTYTFTGLQSGVEYQLHIYIEDDEENISKTTIHRESTLTFAETAGGVVFAESSKGSNGLYITSVLGGMYRFRGSDSAVNNYLCFGTTSKCSEEDNNMYRIIGIVAEDEQLTDYERKMGIQPGDIKVIKQNSIGSQKWYSSIGVDIKWSESFIYQK